MSKKKVINLAVLLFCVLLFAVMCLPKREQPKEEIIREYHKYRDAFQYIKVYFINNDVSQIRKDSGKIIVILNVITPLEEINDALLVQCVHLLFDDLHYFRISNTSTWKTNVLQLTFKKDTNKTYYKEIVYCRDDAPPSSTGVFTDVEQIEKYWFYCEEDEDEDLF